ncbi:uncharacterized protein P7C70_g5928, partial [Phenoliferia sp. Uapishka_3]
MSHAAALKHQFGLTKDPRALEIVPATNTFPKLVRTITPGGSGADSDQPGFPIFHRHVASPIPLGALAVGASLFILGLTLVHSRSMKTTTIFYAVGLPYGGVGASLAGLWFYPQGQTFGMTLFGTLGGLFISFCMADLPWAGVQNAYITSAPTALEGVASLEQALGLLVFVTFIVVFMPNFVRLPLACDPKPLINPRGARRYGASFLLGKDSLQVAGGSLFIVVGVSLYYVAASALLHDEGLTFLPLFPLPHVDG